MKLDLQYQVTELETKIKEGNKMEIEIEEMQKELNPLRQKVSAYDCVLPSLVTRINLLLD